VDAGAALSESVGDAIADTAGAADHQHRLSGEIGVVHSGQG